MIAAIHNACIGGGVDLLSATDIRYCTTDAWFQLKETDIGLYIFKYEIFKLEVLYFVYKYIRISHISI